MTDISLPCMHPNSNLDIWNVEEEAIYGNET